MKGKKGKNGSKKYGRMKNKCERYKNEKRREKNKVRKLTKYLKSHPNNLVAVKALEKYQAMI